MNFLRDIDGSEVLYNKHSMITYYDYWYNICNKYEYQKWKPVIKNDITSSKMNLLKHQKIEIDGKHKNMMEYIMKNHLGEFALKEIGFEYVKESRTVIYDLCWYIMMSDINLEIFSGTAITFLTFCKTRTLLGILGGNFPHDDYESYNRATIIFAILSGKNVINPYYGPKDILDDLPEDMAWVIAHDIVGINKSYRWPPYSFIPYEDYDAEYVSIIIKVNNDNIVDYMKKYGFVPGRPVKNMIHFFIKELWYMVHMDIMNISSQFFDGRQIDIHKVIFDHEEGKYTENLGPIPTFEELQWYDSIQIEYILEYYTTVEIIETFDPIGTWKYKRDLLKLVSNQLKTPMFRMHMKKHSCTNFDLMNLTTLKPHLEDRPTKKDPIIYYGYPGNYKCYQLSELEDTFRIYSDDGMFHFGVPDYIPNVSQKFFPIDSIKQLKEILPSYEPFSNLSDIIEKGLEYGDIVKKTITDIFNIYDSMDYSRKYTVQLYLIWLFLFGMWLRNWKGPGYDWPFGGRDHQDLDNKCDDETRSENFLIQIYVRNVILKLADNFGTLDFINDNIKILSYDFATGDVNIAHHGQSVLERIEELIDLMYNGHFCLTHASDIVIQTSYCYIFKFFELKNDDEFNITLKSMIPIIYETERRVVVQLLKTADDKEFLNNRYQMLSAVPIVNYPFSKSKITDSAHIDPEFGRGIVMMK